MLHRVLCLAIGSLLGGNGARQQCPSCLNGSEDTLTYYSYMRSRIFYVALIVSYPHIYTTLSILNRKTNSQFLHVCSNANFTCSPENVLVGQKFRIYGYISSFRYVLWHYFKPNCLTLLGDR